MRINKFILATAAILMLGAPSFAADMDEPVLVPAQEEYQPVEIGSGWYLRGDVGYTINKPYDKFEESNGYNFSDSPLILSGGVGYHMNDYLRLELSGGILPTQKFKTNYLSNCMGTQTTTTVIHRVNSEDQVNVDRQRTSRDCMGENGGVNKAYDGMANIYADLGTYAGLTPYVGAGVGLIYSKYRAYQGDRHCVEPIDQVIQGGNITKTINWSCDDAATYVGQEDSERQFGLAYALSTGVSWKATENVSFDLGYQYKGAPGMRYVLRPDGSGDLVVKKGTDYHTVKVGLRYDLW